MPQLSFLMALAIMPACLGFAGYTPCVDNDDAVPEYATALGVTEVSTCADVLTNGYCPSVPPDLLHHCCASCAGSVDDSVRLSHLARGKSSLAQRGERCMNFGDSCDCAPGLFCLDTNHWGRIFGYYEFKCGSDPMSDASRGGTHGSKAADEPCSKHEALPIISQKLGPTYLDPFRRSQLNEE